MISLLLAYFGKNRIPDSVRLILLSIGLAFLFIRLNRIRRAHLEYQKAMLIGQEIQRRTET